MDLCRVCHQEKEELLTLKCQHDTCIQCTLRNYNSSSLRFKNPNIYFCSICLQSTQLMTETISKLTQMNKSQDFKVYRNVLIEKTQSKRQSEKVQRNSVKLQRQDHRDYDQKKDTVNEDSDLLEYSPSKSEIQYQIPNGTIIMNLEDAKTSDIKITNLITQCKDHEQQLISYYCINCKVNICSECVIHGEHYNHKVQLLSKAMGERRDILTIVITQLDSWIETILKNKEQIKQKFIKIKEVHEIQRQKVKGNFNKLYALLKIKQNQIIDEINTIQKESLKQVTVLTQQNEAKHGTINLIKKHTKQLIRKSSKNQITIKDLQLQILKKNQLLNKRNQYTSIPHKQVKSVTTKLVNEVIEDIKLIVNQLKVQAISLKNLID